MTTPLTTPQVAVAGLDTRHAHARIAVAVTPVGLLAIGGLVTGILLGTAVIVRVALAGRPRGGRGAGASRSGR
jgi:hypothetical protein